jgi:hypothetical protein
MRPLAELERELLRAITGAHDHAGATAVDVPVLDEIRGDARLSAVGRLDVYARMYCARLVDALREDYPRLAALLGVEAFGDVAHAYVEVHPSTHPSLRWFGRHVADFLARADRDDVPPFAADLARLEWTRLAVFDAADGDLLDLPSLRAVAPEAWPILRLRLAPAVEVLTLAWPAHRIWEAAGTDVPMGAFEPAETHLRVWRQGDRVFQAAMDVTERAALASVAAGETFGELCERVATVVGPDGAAVTAGALVLRWVEDSILAASPHS